ncbi:MAG: hypothetical protein DRP63_01180 [Planctomycetota bacterium]|nr:MAG: hypothetical protein DRP63_01180 [Planctomycetota bacterium]
MEEEGLKLIISEQGKEWEYPIKGFPITMGRGANNVIVLIDPKASRRHCVIEKSDEGIIIRDLGSRNGTTVNGSRIEVSPLKEGDIIGVGDTLIYFGRKKEVREEKAEFCLYVVRGEHEGKEFPLVNLPLTIGRKKGNKIVLSDERVSGEHARVDFEGGRFVLVDLKSTNGTYVGGRRIEREVLEMGTRFAISDTVFEFRKIGEAPPADVEKPAVESVGGALQAPPDTLREEDVELDLERARRQAAVPKVLVVVVALFVIGAALFLVYQLLRAGGIATLYKGGLIVINPSFEEEENGEVAGWVTEPAKVAVRDATIAKQGKFSLHLSPAANREMTILRYNDDIAVRAGSAYRLHFQVRTENTQACVLRVDWLSDKNPDYHKVEFGRLLEGTRRDWTPLSYTFVVPPEATKMRVGLALLGSRGECWVDEAKLTKAESAPQRQVTSKKFSAWLSGHGTVDLSILSIGNLSVVQDIEGYICRLKETGTPPPDAYQSRAVVDEPVIQNSVAEVRGQLNCGTGTRVDFVQTLSPAKEGLRLSYKFTGGIPADTMFALRMLLPKRRVNRLEAVAQGKKVVVETAKTEWTAWGVTELIIKVGTSKMVLRFSLPVRCVMTQEGAYLRVEVDVRADEMPRSPEFVIDVQPFSREEKKGALDALERIKALLEAERYQEAARLARRYVADPLLTDDDKRWLQTVWSNRDQAGRRWLARMEAMFEDIITTPRAEIRDALVSAAQKVAQSYPEGDLRERAASLVLRAKEAVKKGWEKRRVHAAETMLQKAKELHQNHLRGYAAVILSEIVARYPNTNAAQEARNLLEDIRFERGR